MRYLKATALVIGFLIALGLAGNIEAHASIDPIAHEVVMQTWYGKINNKDKRHYCNTRNAKAIVRKYNSNASTEGKIELVKAYRFYILDNC